MRLLWLSLLFISVGLQAEDQITNVQHMNNSSDVYYVKNSTELCNGYMEYYKGRVERHCNPIITEQRDKEDTFDFYFRNQEIIAKQKIMDEDGVEIIGDISQTYFQLSDNRICHAGDRRYTHSVINCYKKPNSKIQENVASIDGDESGLKNLYLFKYAKEEQEIAREKAEQHLSYFKGDIEGVDSSKVLIKKVTLKKVKRKCEDIKRRSNILGMLITIGTQGYYNFDFSRAQETRCELTFTSQVNFKVGGESKVENYRSYSYVKLPYKNRGLKRLFKKNMKIVSTDYKKNFKQLLCKEFRCK